MNIAQLKRIAQDHPRYGLVFVLILFLFLAYVLTSNSVEAPATEQVVPEEVSVTTVLPESEPTVLSIPAINLETTFEEPLGLKPDRSSEVPDSYTKVGWYKYGPTPGELGPAVILGHVDSYEGPAVFFSLGQLEEGDDIFVTRKDGSTAHFIVTRLDRPSQDSFPTRDVYSDIDHAGLRLITCSGTFQQGIQRYTHNLIVYAALAPQETSSQSSL